jgi:hypothetical protein
MEAAPKPDGAGEANPAKAELPSVESPPLSPGTETPAVATDTPAPAIESIKTDKPAIEPVAVVVLAVEPIANVAPVAKPLFVLRPRHKRYALLAASVTFAAALGAVVGALASGGFSTPVPAKPDLAAIEQNKAMQQSIALLGKEITTLKAALEQANKSAHVQLAKISDRLDHATAEITGSIAAPQTTAPVLTPLPVPRPQPRIAAVEPAPRVPVVLSWTIHDVRNGYVYVENHGEIYQVALGAPLPGLGPVQSVKRQDGRWMVLTPKGIIVSMRDRRYFEEF